jgi:ABC-type phosphate/phosphonate transport system substrate-binding protein
MFLFLKLKGEKSLAFDVDDYEGFLEYFRLGSLDFADTQNGPAVQASMV